MLEFNLVLRFLLELGAIAAVSYWGFHVRQGWSSIALGVGAPMLLAVFWGLFVAPRAPVPSPPAVKTALSLAVFALAAAALAHAGRRRWAAFIVVALFNAWGLYLAQA